ncbi:MAG: ribose-phosphate pyrophosphokinase [Thaumarchaeota archaeon]|nr:ribose-phosphate pyrophosphokinase [Nitrososphaerota archaeon]
MAGFTVIGGPSSEQLARRVASRLGSRYVGCDLRVFPDGESKITLKGKPSGRIVVVQSVYPPVDSNLVRALALVSQARKYSSQVYAVVPYMGYARQDREFLPREVVTMSLVAKMFKAAGAARMLVVDIHSMTALKHFQFPSKNVTAVGELVRYFKKMRLMDPLVVSPDMGGAGRARNFAGLLGTGYIALEKHRDRRSGEVTIKSSTNRDVRDRDIIIVDDMISTGGSIVKASEHLRKQRCGKIYATCTHALLIGDAEKRIKKAGVSRIVSTNTIPGRTAMVDVSPAIARAIA